MAGTWVPRTAHRENDGGAALPPGGRGQRPQGGAPGCRRRCQAFGRPRAAPSHARRCRCRRCRTRAGGGRVADLCNETHPHPRGVLPGRGHRRRSPEPRWHDLPRGRKNGAGVQSPRTGTPVAVRCCHQVAEGSGRKAAHPDTSEMPGGRAGVPAPRIRPRPAMPTMSLRDGMADLCVDTHPHQRLHELATNVQQADAGEACFPGATKGNDGHSHVATISRAVAGARLGWPSTKHTARGRPGAATEASDHGAARPDSDAGRPRGRPIRPGPALPMSTVSNSTRFAGRMASACRNTRPPTKANVQHADAPEVCTLGVTTGDDGRRHVATISREGEGGGGRTARVSKPQGPAHREEPARRCHHVAEASGQVVEASGQGAARPDTTGDAGRASGRPRAAHSSRPGDADVDDVELERDEWRTCVIKHTHTNECARSPQTCTKRMPARCAWPRGTIAVAMISREGEGYGRGRGARVAKHQGPAHREDSSGPALPPGDGGYQPGHRRRCWAVPAPRIRPRPATPMSTMSNSTEPGEE